MSDYYDAWSANKRKKSPGTNAYSGRLRRQQQHQQQSSTPDATTSASSTTIPTTATTTTAATTATTATPPSTTTTPTPPRTHSSLLLPLDQRVLPLASFSPALPRYPTTTTPTVSFKAGPSGTTPFHNKTNTTLTTTTIATRPTISPRSRPISAWRFSRTIFDSSLRSSSHDGSTSYVTDFDDVEDDDDDEDEDDDEEDEGAGRDDNYKMSGYLSDVSVIPRIQGPTSSGTTLSTTALAAPSFKNPLMWPGGTTSTSRPSSTTKAQQPRQEDHGPTIEQLNTPDERLAATYSQYTSFAKSSPALSGQALLAPADHPQSTTTFNTRMYPQPILQHLTHHTDQQRQTPLSLASTSVTRKQQQGRRPRPWSQVIWESPLLGEDSQGNQHQQQQQAQQSQQRIRDHSIPVGPRPATAYPALRNDMFTPATAGTEKDKERVINKSVRINIDGDATITATAGSTTYPRVPAQTGDNSTRLTPKRELSHGRKTMNRISLGSGFYASIEPISLSTATPSTPKTRRHLVRLPARPQSVLIPSTAHHFPRSGSGIPSGAGAQLNGARLGAGLQPISTEQFKRRRHKSQQLEMKGDSPRTVPIPWQQLTPMGAHDNAKTFHGVGSAPAVPTPILKKGGSQEDAFGATRLHPLNETSEPARLPPPTPRKPSPFTKPNAPYMRHQDRTSQSQGQGLPRLTSPPTSTPTSFSFSSSQQYSPSFTPSWFLPALLESSSSFLFKKTLPSSIVSTSSPSSFSPKRATFGLQPGSTSSPTRFLSNNNSNTSSYSPDRILASSSHLHLPSSLQTRQSLPISRPTSAINHYHHDSSSSNSSSGNSNHVDSLLKKSRRNLTVSLTPTSFFSSINSSNNNDPNAANNNRSQRSSVPVSGTSSYSNSSNNSNNCNTSTTTTTTTKTALWKRDSSSVFFPFSLVSYESGGLLGEIKNTSTTICTNAPSSVVAPGTPIPPGVIVSTGVPPLMVPSSSSSASSPTMDSVVIVPTISITTPPTFLRSPGSSSTLDSSRSHDDFDNRSSTSTRLASEVVQYREEPRDDLVRHAVSQGDSQDGGSDDNDHKNGDSEKEKDEKEDDEETNNSYYDEEEHEGEYGHEEMYTETGLDDSIVIQKSHVAVYEINARWGSRLMMFLVTLGGIFCALGGGLCAEHHCKDLGLCPDDYQAHGNWCGPSGVEGAPYMLTVGLSMCTFGLYAMAHLRSPTSRLVGYSEIDQFL
ncbi:hypothetical protein BGZ47_008194 [Haplosporangium gracile]|nr:hypothetical protein BGZ47_008194 [Haplosporangium gracile]